MGHNGWLFSMTSSSIGTFLGDVAFYYIIIGFDDFVRPEAW